MQIKTISQLLKEGADLQKLLDFLMETESQSFVSELQEKRETYFNRINTFPEYVFLFFDDENNYVWWTIDKNYPVDDTDYWAEIPMPEPRIPAYKEED